MRASAGRSSHLGTGEHPAVDDERATAAKLCGGDGGGLDDWVAVGVWHYLQERLERAEVVLGECSMAERNDGRDPPRRYRESQPAQRWWLRSYAAR